MLPLRFVLRLKPCRSAQKNRSPRLALWRVWEVLCPCTFACRRIRMTNESDKSLEIKKGEAFAQGIFLQYYTTADDSVTEQRSGGLGSTTKKI